MRNKIERLYDQGVQYFNQRNFVKAKSAFAEALSFIPDDPQLNTALATVLRNMAEYGQAQHYYEIALRNSGDEPATDLLEGYAKLFKITGQIDKSLIVYEEILRRDPENPHILISLAEGYLILYKFDKALVHLKKVEENHPLNTAVLLGLSKAYHSMCMWEEAEEIDQKLVDVSKEKIAQNAFIPLNIHTVFLFEKQASFIKEVAINQSKYTAALLNSRGGSIQRRNHVKTEGRYKVGYLSSALSKHATAYLLQAYFENHDREKFEISIFSGKLKLPCIAHEKIRDGVENFFDVSEMSDPEVAQFIHDKNLDVLIDLDGFISHSKRGAFYFKPCPVAIQWLGTPSTSGAPWIDYILADNMVIPKELEKHYTEDVLRMPDCYFFNSFKAMDVELSDKEKWGLPKDKFIFASFNISRKVDRETFLAWCEILRRVDNSVLWMLIDNEETRLNLENILKENKIDPSRLIPAERVDNDKHMSRLHNADLMLDCFICGAHTTAVEALWFELPLVTKIGETFHSRVPSSILSAAGLSELITNSTDEFIDKAVEIALDPDKLASIKEHLKVNKNELPLFDQKKWLKDFEAILVDVIKKNREETSHGSDH